MYVSENETGRGKVFKVPVILFMTDVQWLKENKLFYFILFNDKKNSKESYLIRTLYTVTKLPIFWGCHRNFAVLSLENNYLFWPEHFSRLHVVFLISPGKKSNPAWRRDNDRNSQKNFQNGRRKSR
jgi:hypothetical protein